MKSTFVFKNHLRKRLIHLLKHVPITKTPTKKKEEKENSRKKEWQRTKSIDRLVDFRPREADSFPKYLIVGLSSALSRRTEALKAG